MIMFMNIKHEEQVEDSLHMTDAVTTCMYHCMVIFLKIDDYDF